MNITEQSLKNLERQTASSLFQTGVADLSIGMVFIITSFAGIFDDYRYYIDALLILPLILSIVLSVKYIKPRLGTVKLAPKRVRKTKTLIISLTFFLVVMVSLTFFSQGEPVKIFSPVLILTGIILGIFFLLGWFLVFTRMYYYGVLTALAFNLNEVMRDIPVWGDYRQFLNLLVALLIFNTGLVLFIRFLRNFPKPSKQINYERS